MGEALRIFRNPPLLEITPFNVAPPPGPVDIADTTGNIAYFNNLRTPNGSGGFSTIGDPLSINFITPPLGVGNSVYWANLGIRLPDTSPSDNNVGLYVYEDYAGPIKLPGGYPTRFTRMFIASNGGVGPFAISTDYSTTGGFPRDIGMCPAGKFMFGSNGSTQWEVVLSSASSPNALCPKQHTSYDLGMPLQALYNVYSMNYRVINNAGVVRATLFQQTTNVGPLLQMGKSVANPGSPPGPDILNIWVTAGTTGGTLKLCCQAGNLGAITTILDNIPQ